MKKLIAPAAVVTAFAVLPVKAQDHLEALEESWSILDSYCMECHSFDEFRGGLALEGMRPLDVDANPGIFEEVLRKLKIHAMPPRSQPQPDLADRNKFIAALEATLDEAAFSDPYAGTTSIHRLNREEYTNAIRDLLGVDLDLSELLPSDAGGHGFDNIADLLRTSPMLLDRYMTVGMRVTDLALGNAETQLSVTTYQIPFDTTQEKHLEGMPLGTRGGVRAKHYFPVDGEYVFSARPLQGVAEGYFGIEGHDKPHEFLIYLDGEIVYTSEIGGTEQHEISVKEFNDVIPIVNEELTSPKISVTAGPHEVIFTWRERRPAEMNSWQPVQRDTLEIHNSSGMPRLEEASIEGPYNPGGVSEMATRDQVLVCRPESVEQEDDCARQILANLARKAYRRPIENDDIAAPLAFYEQERALGSDFDAGIRTAVARMIVSPFFLFRVETDAPDTAPGSNQPISSLEIASRMSFFLWSTVPDDELLELGENDVLTSSEVRAKQVERMLADPRANAFVQNFVGQWLTLRNLEKVARPDIQMFPDFDNNLRQAFREETERLFAYILRENRPVHELLTADYTFVNERLAKHYGIDGVYGARFRKVDVEDPNRFGILGHGSIHSLTSASSRTSPIMRGKFILTELWNNPPPPPIPNVPALEASIPEGRPSTVREQLERHRADPVCAGCHDLIDPMGFALENFDVDGSWRDFNKEGLPIDASGTLLDGTVIQGPIQMREALVADPEIFAGTVTEKLLIYALGRGLDPKDRPIVRRIVRMAEKDNYSLQSLILGIIESYPFLMRTNSSRSSINTIATTEN